MYTLDGTENFFLMPILINCIKEWNQGVIKKKSNQDSLIELKLLKS